MARLGFFLGWYPLNTTAPPPHPLLISEYFTSCVDTNPIYPLCNCQMLMNGYFFYIALRKKIMKFPYIRCEPGCPDSEHPPPPQPGGLFAAESIVRSLTTISRRFIYQHYIYSYNYIEQNYSLLKNPPPRYFIKKKKSQY